MRVHSSKLQWSLRINSEWMRKFLPTLIKFQNSPPSCCLVLSPPDLDILKFQFRKGRKIRIPPSGLAPGIGDSAPDV